MEDSLFAAIDELLETGDAKAFDYLIGQFLEKRNYPLLFEARLMKRRFELGLPLIQMESSAEFPGEARRAYEETMVKTAREVGSLFLGEGNIERAWPYFRAIGEVAPIRAALETVEPGEDIDPVIQIAYQEGVHPVKGLDLILTRYGMCRAITSFQMYAVPEGREECIHLLASAITKDVAANLKRAIEQHEGTKPETENVSELVAGRDWLFGEYDYYVDTSHLGSVIQYAPEITRRDTLELIVELCDYGKRLSQQFVSQGQPPFENPYVDYAFYAKAMLGEDVDGVIAHFEEKVTGSDPEEVGSQPAETLVKLLVRLERYQEALEVSLTHLREPRYELTCPSPLQLCHMAGDHKRLRELAREKGDILSYAAAALAGAPSPKPK